MNVLFYTISID